MSNIEWTELTWNPTTGCDKISAGCKFCYAETMSKRLFHMGIDKYKKNFDIAIHPQELKTPFTWKKPKVVFVNSMSDLFHEDVPLEYIQQVFEVMNNTPQHIYQVLTKRSERLAEISSELTWTKNIWMGVSVEEEKVSYRILDLISSDAKVKFLSVEPLIGAVKNLYLDKIDWVIVGGESGPKARPMEKEWVEFVHEECNKSKVPFFFKQWGKPRNNDNQLDPTLSKEHPKHAKGGCELNGRIHRQMPKGGRKLYAVG